MKQVLNVGHCDFDHGNIQTLIASHFAADVTRARTAQQAFEFAQQQTWDLILINRVFEEDGDSGLDLIHALKADPVTRSNPVMLVSNYADAQRAAIEAGAVPGFGKASLNTAATLEELKKLL
jgi:response regulator RpfG family c-di-GMP phosphodiesterase